MLERVAGALSIYSGCGAGIVLKFKVLPTNNNNNNNNIFISYIKYTNITPPANSKANQGRWCVDGLRFITIVEVKKYHIYNKKGHSRKKGKRKENEKNKNKKEKLR